ncbi:DUF2726 domain-containing protein (plasmid) [Deinococcus wulumuqiensis]|uniref:DUF2726 domain-containing protein n=1 Tax=Deinococcus wulumuqiensis TaxID=980427 RepID=A0A345ILM9_9DEIO|nr:DUF2726 domain-containing protein [Deinococcus wulumuqiensis]
MASPSRPPPAGAWKTGSSRSPARISPAPSTSPWSSPRTTCCAPPCDSATERRVFEVCLHLFEGSVVLPNVPLARIVETDAARHYLDQEDQKFLGNPATQVDIVVLGKNLLPVLAIEADGPQHDLDPQHSRDARKNRILRVAGLPIARLRVRARMSDDVLAHHLGKALWEAARIARPSHRGHVELARALSRLTPSPCTGEADAGKHMAQDHKGQGTVRSSTMGQVSTDEAGT